MDINSYKIVKLEELSLKNQNFIKLTFSNPSLFDFFKMITDVKAPKTKEYCYFSNNIENIKKIILICAKNNILLDKTDFSVKLPNSTLLSPIATENFEMQLLTFHSSLNTEVKYLNSIQNMMRVEEPTRMTRTRTRKIPEFSKPVKQRVSPHAIVDKPIVSEYNEKMQGVGYSKNTVKTYTCLFRDFTNFFPDKEIKDLELDDLKTFQHYIIEIKKASISQQNQALNAIRFYYEKMQPSKLAYFDELERPKREVSLPTTLSKEEIVDMIDTIDNIKHKAMVSLLYFSGLRISEIIGLKVADIDYDKLKIRIHSEKPSENRNAELPKKMLNLIDEYISDYRPSDWLFEGPGKTQYSTRSIDKIIKRAAEAAGIDKNITSNMLRHSFAVHSLEKGVKLKKLKKMLGHNSIKTTEVYQNVLLNSQS